MARAALFLRIYQSLMSKFSVDVRTLKAMAMWLTALGAQTFGIEATCTILESRTNGTVVIKHRLGFVLTHHLDIDPIDWACQ